ncbi:serpin B10-like [Mytilus californianus]|uniref:serpin B10-like n=1 Tax=Mytilus californianus TaxID=6549 RepID=UPI002246496C|nr:serpin B10-like [Mytilus californianus]
MFPPETITSGTKMVLANAIYFKGNWKKEFNPHNTTKRNFLDNSNQQKQVDMMYDQRYVVAAKYDLKPVLTSLGINEIFDSQTANFAKMTTMKSVFVTDARHKSYIEVTEQGTEAAAATTIEMGLGSSMSGPFQFVADHPFMFVIRDNNSGTILFIGRYANP